MAKYALQTSNVASYTFGGSGSTSNNYVLVPNNNPILNIAGDTWTIECWVRPTGNYTNLNNLFAKRPTSALPTAYNGYITTGGFPAWSTNSGADIIATGARISPNVWNHIAYVNNGANLRIFLNGSNVAINATGGFNNTSNGNVDSIFAIGALPAVPTTTQYFGEISNFRIIKSQAIYSSDFNISKFPFQLSNTSIGYHAGTTGVAASLTGNVILLTCNDAKIQSNGNTTLNGLSYVGDVYPHMVDSKDLQNFSYYYPGNTNFQGQNATVLVTNATNVLNLNTADFTIETWFYPTSNTGVILERGYGAERNNLASYILTWDTVNNSVNFAAANANNAAGYAVGGLTGPSGNVGAPTLNAWNHIAIARTGTTYRGFLNGTLNLNITTNANNPYDAIGRGVTIGGMFNNGQTFATGIPANTISGYISNLRIIRGNSIYNAAFTANTTQLTNVNNTILLTGLTPLFEDLSGNHTLAVNGMNQIFFSPSSPFTANAIVAGISNLNMTSAASSTSRTYKVYSKFNYGLNGISPYLLNATSNRFPKVVNKFTGILGSVSPFLVKSTSNRFPKVVNKFTGILGSVSPFLVKSTSNRFPKVVNKFTGILGTVSPFFLNALSNRRPKVYDKIDIGKFSFPVDTRNYTIGSRSYKTYDKYDVGRYSYAITIRNYTGGSPRTYKVYSKINYVLNSASPFLLKSTSNRLPRVYMKFSAYVLDTVSDTIPKATSSSRQTKIYTKVTTGKFGYLTYPPDRIVANISYQFWS